MSNLLTVQSPYFFIMMYLRKYYFKQQDCNFIRANHFILSLDLSIDLAVILLEEI